MLCDVCPTAKPRSAQTEVQVCAIGADVEPAIRKIRFRKAKDNAALIRAHLKRFS